MPFAPDEKDFMLNASRTAGRITHLALFDGDPSDGGTEIEGGSPAYARKAITLPEASGGSINHTTEVTFDVPAGATVNHIGYMSASSGGSLRGWDEVTEEVYGAQGEYKHSQATLAINDPS